MRLRRIRHGHICYGFADSRPMYGLVNPRIFLDLISSLYYTKTGRGISVCFSFLGAFRPHHSGRHTVCCRIKKQTDGYRSVLRSYDIEPFGFLVDAALLDGVLGIVIITKLLIFDRYLCTCGYALCDECITADDNVTAYHRITA